MIGSAVIEFADLQRISGYTRLADVERWAIDNGLPFKRCRGGIWTMTDAVNRAFGVRDDAPLPLYEGDVV